MKRSEKRSRGTAATALAFIHKSVSRQTSFHTNVSTYSRPQWVDIKDIIICKFKLQNIRYIPNDWQIALLVGVGINYLWSVHLLKYCGISPALKWRCPVQPFGRSRTPAFSSHTARRRHCSSSQSNHKITENNLLFAFSPQRTTWSCTMMPDYTD